MLMIICLRPGMSTEVLNTVWVLLAFSDHGRMFGMIGMDDVSGVYGITALWLIFFFSHFILVPAFRSSYV
jgi:hypothetical protein